MVTEHRLFFMLTVKNKLYAKQAFGLGINLLKMLITALAGQRTIMATVNGSTCTSVVLISCQSSECSAHGKCQATAPNISLQELADSISVISLLICLSVSGELLCQIGNIFTHFPDHLHYCKLLFISSVMSLWFVCPLINNNREADNLVQILGNSKKLK